MARRATAALVVLLCSTCAWASELAVQHVDTGTAGTVDLVVVPHASAGSALLAADQAALKVHLPGLRELSRTVSAASDGTIQTALVLDLRQGGTEELEVARAWGRHSKLTEQVTVVAAGRTLPPRTVTGAGALFDLLDDLRGAPHAGRDPTVREALEIGLGALGPGTGEGARRLVWVSADASDLDAATPLSEPVLLHSVVIAPRVVGAPLDPTPNLSSAVEHSGGQRVIVSDTHDAQRRLAALAQPVAPRFEVSLTFCATGEPLQDGTLTLADATAALAPTEAPPCPVEAETEPRARRRPAATADPPPPTQDLPALWLGGALLVGVALTLTLVLLRRRPPPSPEPPRRAPRPVLTLVEPTKDATGPPSVVVVLEVQHRDTVLVLERTEGAFTLGSSESCDVTLDLPGLAGRHARFERFPGGAVLVTDAHSTTGTWFEGTRLDMGERRLLKPGEQVMLGPEIRVVLVHVGPPRDAA